MQSFLGLARAVLRDRFADVYSAVHEVGATEVRQDSFLCDAAREAGDEDLATVACRRPVFDAALHTAVAAQPRVTYRRTEVTGLCLRPHGHAAHVVGVELASGESLTADLVVDIEYHLAQVYIKLGINSRRQLMTGHYDI